MRGSRGRGQELVVIITLVIVVVIAIVVAVVIMTWTLVIRSAADTCSATDVVHVYRGGGYNDSTYVEYAGPALAGGTPYHWTVTTWTTPQGGGSPCKSDPSTPAEFVTSLDTVGWANATKFITLKDGSKSTFGYFRSEIDVPAGVISASAFLTGVNADPLEAGYKFYINGDLIDIGPGRGEAPVWEGDGTFRSLPYMTLDVSEQLTSPTSSPFKAALAFEGMHASNPTVVLQLQLWMRDGSVVTTGTDGTWLGFNGDLHRKPGPARHGHRSVG